jgi:hypothetical protein
MQLTCPNCGTREVRVSQPRGLGELLKGFFGVSALRCRRCNKRWQTSVWSNGSWKYARCPRCYRQELTTWAMQHYNPTRWTRFLLHLGAKPRRCAACRCNFAAFKPRKEHFSWRHDTRVEVGRRVQDQKAAVITEHTPPGEESGEQIP